MHTPTTQQIVAASLMLFIGGCGATVSPTAIDAEDLGLQCEAILLTPDGGQLCAWSELTGVQCVNTNDLSYGANLPSVGMLLACGVNPAGQAIVAADARTPNRIEFHNVQTRETLNTMQYGGRDLRFSPDGTYAIFNIGDSRFARRRVADLTDKLEFRTGESTRLAKTLGFQIAPNQTTLTMVDADGGVVVADWMSGKLVGKRELLFEGDGLGPKYFAFSPSCNSVAAGTKRKLVIWDVPNAHPSQTWQIEYGPYPQHCTFLDDARLITATGAEIQMWTVGEGQPRSLFSHSQTIDALISKGSALFFIDSRNRLYSIALSEL